MDKVYLNLRLVHRKKSDESKFYFEEHAAELIVENDKTYLMRGDMKYEVMKSYTSKDHPSMLRTGEISSMLGISRSDARMLYEYNCSLIFKNSTHYAAIEKKYVEPFLMIPVKKSEQEYMYLLEEVDYRNQKQCVVRTNLMVSKNKARLDEEAKRLRIENKHLNYLVWSIKVV